MSRQSQQASLFLIAAIVISEVHGLLFGVFGERFLFCFPPALLQNDFLILGALFLLRRVDGCAVEASLAYTSAFRMSSLMASSVAAPCAVRAGHNRGHDTSSYQSSVTPLGLISKLTLVIILLVTTVTLHSGPGMICWNYEDKMQMRKCGSGGYHQPEKRASSSAL